MPHVVYVTDPALFYKPKVKEETKDEEAARVAKRQLAVGDEVKTRTDAKYVVDEMIGSGGMGEVYRVHPAIDPELAFAMKTEGNRDDAPDQSKLRLKCETFVYNKIAETSGIEKSHYVKLIDTGRTIAVKFFIMDLVWKPLHTVIGDILNWQLSAHTKVSIARQTLKGIEGLHTIGFLHRDIKPSNFAVGLPPHEKIVYTLDFGIARDYIDKRGKIRVAREKVIFMGTLNYASIAGLQEKEQGRREDLESWLYMMIEIYDRNNLKWRGMGWNQQSECVRMRKELFKYAKRCGVPDMRLPYAYYDIIDIIDGMGYYLKHGRRITEEIGKIERILDSFVKDERIDMSLPLDWVTVCVDGAKRRKERDEKEDEGRGGRRQEEGKDGQRTSKDSKKKEKRRKERDQVEVKIPGSGTDLKKKKRSKSKSASKEKRRHQTQTEDDDSSRSGSDTGHSESAYQLFKQWRSDYRKEHGKKPGDKKKKRSKEGMATAKERDVKEKKAQGFSLHDKVVSGPDLVKETRMDKKDKPIDEKLEVNEKKETKKDMENKRE